MATPILIIRNSFVQYIKRANVVNICIVQWARQRSESEVNASLEVVLEDAFRWWIQELDDIIKLKVPCQAELKELKQARNIEKCCCTSVVQ
ncbi:hypothetical protein DFQ26_001822 [Actinomortierella ambigua]|nr:hypothetical protein DFQ26_001822 [Actinomortierella ambigua]